MKTAISVALVLVLIGWVIFWTVAICRERGKIKLPGLRDLGIGLVFCFLDSLGVGSYAPATAVFKSWRLVSDEDIPGTLNVGFSITGILEAIFYIAVVKVDAITLVSMIAAAVFGAWSAGRVVSIWPRRRIQIGMGIALLATAMIAFLRQIGVFPSGGDLLGLAGPKLIVGMLFYSILGALKTIGFGFYAPSLMMACLMGLNEKSVYPIMIGSIAFAGPIASIPFVQRKRYNLKSALGITIGGIPGVLVAVFLVTSLPLDMVRWLVLLVMVYAAITMLRSARSALAEAHAMPSKLYRSRS